MKTEVKLSVQKIQEPILIISESNRHGELSKIIHPLTQDECLWLAEALLKQYSSMMLHKKLQRGVRKRYPKKKNHELMIEVNVPKKQRSKK